MYFAPEPPSEGPAVIAVTRPGPRLVRGASVTPLLASDWSLQPDAGLSLADAARGSRPSRLLTRGPARLAFLFSVTFLDTGFRLLVSLEPIGGAFHSCQARK